MAGMLGPSTIGCTTDLLERSWSRGRTSAGPGRRVSPAFARPFTRRLGNHNRPGRPAARVPGHTAWPPARATTAGPGWTWIHRRFRGVGPLPSPARPGHTG